MNKYLTDRLVAEIESREGHAHQSRLYGRPWATRELAYLAALRKIVELHERVPDEWHGPYGMNPPCETCGTADEYPVRWPCATVAAVAEALEVVV